MRKLNELAAHEVNPTGIPESLKASGHWVCWKSKWTGNRNAKVPVDPKTGKYASVSDPSSWATFNQALEYYENHRAEGISGVGFIFTEADPYVGIDLDKVRNPETGEIETWALEMVEKLESFTEVSPSGEGLHIIIKGTLPEGHNRKEGIEMYSYGRYFTITGHILSNSFNSIEEREEELKALYKEVFGNNDSGILPAKPGGPAPGPEDKELIDVGRAKYGARFKNLWDGNYDGYDSQNEADLALCNYLSLLTHGNGVEVDGLFRLSGLMRKKWDEVHYADGKTTYGQATVEKAVASAGSLSSNRDNKVQATHAIHTDELNDQGNGRDLRYCPKWGCWLVYEGGRWQQDDTGEVQRRAKQTVDAMLAEAAHTSDEDKQRRIARHAANSGNHARRQAMIASASSEKDVVVRPEDMDSDPWVFNCLNGTVDLQTGGLRPHCREDLITKLAPVDFDPAAICPTWMRFLDQILPDKDLQSYLQKAAGYSLTGITREQVLFILYGLGANGKSTLLEILMTLLGHYARPTSSETFMLKKNGQIPNDLAALQGARFVSAVEVEVGRHLAESLIKQVTGEDEINARFLHKEWFSFRPQFKLWMAVNHKPRIRGSDYAIWRRIHLLPFKVQVPEEKQDKELSRKLKTEITGILNWALQGCLDWQKNGLGAPPAVKAAVAGYREEMDIIGDFIKDCCAAHPEAAVPASDLYAAYTDWAEANGEKKPLSQHTFGTILTECCFGKGTNGKQRLRTGISLVGCC